MLKFLKEAYSVEDSERDGYPLPAFYFSVVFSKASNITDSAFKEVSGIKLEMETDPYQEGGENRFSHQLPKGVKQSRLVLKRGVAKKDSPLVEMCSDVLEGDFSSPIEPVAMDLYLLNAEGEIARGWSFDNVFPLVWEVDGFDSMKNEVAIEKIELNYNSVKRTE